MAGASTVSWTGKDIGHHNVKLPINFCVRHGVTGGQPCLLPMVSAVRPPPADQYRHRPPLPAQRRSCHRQNAGSASRSPAPTVRRAAGRSLATAGRHAWVVGCVPVRGPGSTQVDRGWIGQFAPWSARSRASGRDLDRFKLKLPGSPAPVGLPPPELCRTERNSPGAAPSRKRLPQWVDIFGRDSAVEERAMRLSANVGKAGIPLAENYCLHRLSACRSATSTPDTGPQPSRRQSRPTSHPGDRRPIFRSSHRRRMIHDAMRPVVVPAGARGVLVIGHSSWAPAG